MAKSKKNPQHYVDNKKLLEEMKKFKKMCKDAEAVGDNMPPVPHYVGECFLKIANGLSFRPNFINYTYRDEMISDGIENCLQYVYNFDPNKSKNPVPITNLQKEVWDHKSKLETHTVETHIYRLRKKIANEFGKDLTIINKIGNYALKYN